MLGKLRKKGQTALRVLKNEGFAPVLTLAWQRVKFFIMGRLIGISGNRVRVGNCEFDVSNPMIVPELKASLYFDTYEKPERNLIQQYLPVSLPVIEMGAGIGIVSCFTNKLLENGEQHIVVEANPDLIPIILQNRELNQCKFTVEHAAVGYDADEIKLYVQPSLIESSVKATSAREVNVQTINLAQLLDRMDAEAVTLICDIEGVEVDLVEKEIDLIASKVALFIVEVHSIFVGDAAVEHMLEQLKAKGFTRIDGYAWSHVFVNKTLSSIPPMTAQLYA